MLFPGIGHCIPEGGGHVVPGSGGHFECSVCGRTYQTEGGRLIHMKKHQGLTKCPVCGKTFSIVPSVRWHMRTVHRMDPDEIYRLVPKLVR